MTLSVAAYRLGRGVIWLQPAAAMAAETVRWVLLAELVWAGVQLARRKLDTALAATLLLVALLSVLGTYEYAVQQLGFLRSGPHTVIALTGFAVWLLWMLQKTGQMVGVGSSPRWPAAARLALFAGVLVLVMAQVHARGARLDPGFSNEVFLLLYRAFVDIGIPYALFVWAGRSLSALPARTGSMVLAFACGALLTLPVHAVGRWDACGWDLGRLHSLLAERAGAMMAGDMRPFYTDPAASWGWVALRGATLLGLAAATGAVIERRRGGGTSVVLLLAASAGFASFSRAMLDIPVLPPRWIALVAPARITFELDAHVVASYVIWSLPVLLLGVVAASRTGLARWPIGFGVGLAVHFVAAGLWPGHDAWLHSTGLLWTLGAGATALLVAFTASARRLVDAGEPVRSGWHRRAGWVGAACLLATLSGWQAWTGRSVGRPMNGLGGPLEVPAWWQAAPVPPGFSAAFRRVATGLVPPTLLASVVDRPEEGAAGALAATIERMKQAIPGVESWDQAPGGSAMIVQDAVVAAFSFAAPLSGGGSLPVSGGVLARDIGRRTLVLVWMGPPGDYDRERWDLARIAQAAR